MWKPTHVLLTIQRAKDLLLKGKHDTNNPFVAILLGREKFQTSIKENAGKDVQWNEQCELPMPFHGMAADIQLTVYHRHNLGVKFLGFACIPLSSFDVYDRPRSRWYKLEGKPLKEKKDKYRGELEMRVEFIVRSSTGSLMDISEIKKNKKSLGRISNMVSGSLLSLTSGEKKTGIKQIARSIKKTVSKKKRDSTEGDGASDPGSKESLSNSPFPPAKSNHRNVDPGVISEDEDEFTFDNLSHKSSGNSINTTSSTLENLAGGEFLRRSSKGPAKPPRAFPPEEAAPDEWAQKLLSKGDTLRRSNPPPPAVSKTVEKAAEETSPVKPVVAERKSLTSSFLEKEKQQTVGEPEVKEMSKLAKAFHAPQLKKKEKKSMERFVVGEEVVKVVEEQSKHSKDVLRQFESKSRDDLIDMVIELQKDVTRSNRQLKELEDYLDQLLLKVMETTPRILQNPYISCKSQVNSLNY